MMKEYLNILLKITPSIDPILIAIMSFFQPKMEGGVENDQNTTAYLGLGEMAEKVTTH